MNNEIDNYDVTTEFDSEQDWIAYLTEMPNISAFGKTKEEAYEELNIAWCEAKKTYLSKGLSLPILHKKTRGSAG